MVRTQIFLTEDEVRLLEAAARSRKTTKSDIVRAALDNELGLKNGRGNILRAFDQSRGAWKGMSLKVRIRRLRSRW